MSDSDTETRLAEVWTNGEAYESYVGRWSRLVSSDFLGWLGVPPGGRWLDVGCGIGTLCRKIIDIAEPEAVLGIDSSEGYVAFAQERIADPRARFALGDARSLPVEDAAFDAVVAGLVLNFVPVVDQEGAVAEMCRAVRPGGDVAAYVWDYAEGMQLMRRFWDEAVALDADARELDESSRFRICRPEPLMALFQAAGLETVTVRAIDVPTVFRDFDDYWTPFLGGQGPAPSYTMSLSADRRATLRDRLQTRLPVASDGSIRLTARAWAVRGRRVHHSIVNPIRSCAL